MLQASVVHRHTLVTTAARKNCKVYSTRITLDKVKTNITNNEEAWDDKSDNHHAYYSFSRVRL